MYRFALMMSPDDVEAVAAQLYVEMLEAGFAAVAEFHYLHNAPDGSPYKEPAEMAGRILSAAGRAGIGITLLPVFYAHSTFGGAPPTPGAEAVRHRHHVVRAARRRIVAGMIKETGGADDRRCATQPSRRDPERTRRTDRARWRWPHSHPRRRADQGGRGLRRFARARAGALAHRPCGRRSQGGASFMRPTWTKARRGISPARAPSPDFVR